MGNESTRFKPGRSGNPSGKSKLKMLTDALRSELAQNPARVRTIADKIITMAEDGDLEAARLIWDRLEGRPIQQVEIDATISTLSPEERMQRVVELQSRIARVIEGDVIDGDAIEAPTPPRAARNAISSAS